MIITQKRILCNFPVCTITSCSITIKHIAIVTSASETSFSICTGLITIVSVVSTFINIYIEVNDANVNSDIQVHLLGCEMQGLSLKKWILYNLPIHTITCCSITI